MVDIHIRLILPIVMLLSMSNAAKQPKGAGMAVVCYAEGLDSFLQGITNDLAKKRVPLKKLTKVKAGTWHNTIMALGKWQEPTRKNLANIGKKGKCKGCKGSVSCWNQADGKAKKIFNNAHTKMFRMKITPESFIPKSNDKNNIIKIYPTVLNKSVDSTNKQNLKKIFKEGEVENTPHITIAYISKDLNKKQNKFLDQWRKSAKTVVGKSGKTFDCFPEIAFFDSTVGSWSNDSKEIRKKNTEKC